MPLSFLTTLALVTPCYCDFMGWKHDSVASSAEMAKMLPAVSKGEGASAASAKDATISRIITTTDVTDDVADDVATSLLSLSDADWVVHRELMIKTHQPTQPTQPTQPLVQWFQLSDLAPMATTEDPGRHGARDRTTEDANPEEVLAQATVEVAPITEDVPSDAAVLEAPEGLVVGVDDLLPPPIPLGEARSELLEILGLDSQVPKDVAPVPKEVPPWALTTYAGRFISDDLGPALIGNLSGFEDSALFGFGVARTIAGRRPLSLELDGQILQHFGNQGHTEGTVAIVARWHNFPWDEKIDTTFAVGEGLSFATSVPTLEINRNGRSTQLLNYLLFEVTFALPQEPDWQVVGRLHHRSGVFGLFDGVGSGSNIYVAGLRRRF